MHPSGILVAWLSYLVGRAGAAAKFGTCRQAKGPEVENEERLI
jgi:hypothetical protein